jgi:hypothetical protein
MLQRNVTGDKTCAHNFESCSKQESKMWKHLTYPKTIFKCQVPADKVLFVYAVQLDTQYSYIIEYIHKLVCSTMFRTSQVHLQERLSCMSGFGK